jgi:ubiquinone/menaquinone biosynthesis methyltransferase
VSNIYDTTFQQALFDEMQDTYEVVSTLCSFGFNRRWRRQLVQRLNLDPGMWMCDLMAGSGETWAYLLPQVGANGQLFAVDFSTSMVAQAETRKRRLRHPAIHILKENALDNSLDANTMDAVLCVYGTKTLADDDMERFVGEVKRLLKPGGVFGLVEVSVPRWLPLRLLYLFYLRSVVPFVGKLFLGNPDNYRMLSRYTERFDNCSRLAASFARAGFDVQYHSFFWGCATAITGVKPTGAPQLRHVTIHSELLEDEAIQATT